MGHSEREYVLKTLRGDRDAYGALVDAYQGMVFAVALNITGNYADSEDVVQEAFLRAYKKLRTLSDPAKFASWLYTIAKRVAQQVLRDKRRIPTAASEEEALAEQVESGAESPAEAYARRELSAILWQQVADLPPKTREAIMLYYAEGFSIKRAAGFLGITEAAMKMRLNFGREKLRERLMDKIEGKLRAHQPTANTRNAILVALPAGGVPSAGLLGLGATKAGLPLLALSAKQMVTIGAVIVIGLATTLLLRTRSPQPPPPRPSPPIAAVQEEGREDFKKAERVGEQDAAVPEAGMISEAQEARYAISGRVIDKHSEDPIPDVTVFLNRGAENITEILTDDQGGFELSDLAEGRYELYLNIEDKGLSDAYYLPPDHSKLSVNVSGRDLEGVTFYLSRASYISGTVIDQDDKPVAEASVQLMHIIDYLKPCAPLVQSDSGGRFRIGGLLPDREYHVYCAAPGYVETQIRGLRTTVASPLDDLIIRLTEGQGATISGWVVNKEGQPVEHALVRASTGSLRYAREFLTLSDGTFRFEGVPPGRVSLSMELYDPKKVSRSP